MSEAGGHDNAAIWRERYEDLARELAASARRARPVLISSTTDIDEIYALRAHELAALEHEAADGAGLAARVASAILDWVGTGKDAELDWRWSEGHEWLRATLAAPTRVQLGGTGPQAAWALASLGAPSVMALACRHPEQLDVLPVTMQIVEDGRLVEVGVATPNTATPPCRHAILECAQGTSWRGMSTPRASRLIVRFAPIGLEVDEGFLALQETLAPEAGAALCSGLNGLDPDDRRSITWVKEVAGSWRRGGVSLRHLELGDTARPEELRRFMAMLHGLFSSIGLSATELLRLSGGERDIPTAAVELATFMGSASVVVHADRWSLAVSRDDDEQILRRLMAGNLLAAARAANGAPQARLEPPAHARYGSDRPAVYQMAPGWHAACVPTPYVERPVSTIGLGDTFAAGMLLAESIPTPGRVCAPVETGKSIA